MKKIAVILSGCGYLDGAEIRESVLALLYLDQAGAEVEIFAPNINQHHIIDHLTGAETAAKIDATRNVLAEAARIARSKILALDELDANKFDALVVPGGFGVAKNLSTLAFKGAEATILPQFASALQSFHSAKKPIGLICIAPAVACLALKNIEVTIGEDAATASVIEALGSHHKICNSDEICVDAANKIVSTSAYMRDDSLAKIAIGIEKLIDKVAELA